MPSFVVGYLTHGNDIIGYRVFDIANGHTRIQDISLPDLRYGLSQGNTLENAELDEDGDKLVFPGSALKHYPCIDAYSKVLRSMPGLTVVAAIENDKSEVIGYTITDTFGLLANVRKAKLIDLSARYRTTNFQVYTLASGERSIKSAYRAFPRVKKEAVAGNTGYDSKRDSAEAIAESKRKTAELEANKKQKEAIDAEMKSQGITQKGPTTITDSKIRSSDSEVVIPSASTIPAGIVVRSFDALSNEALNQSVQKKLTAARFNLKAISPYFGMMYEAIPRKAITAIQTAGVTEDKLFYNPYFISSLTIPRMTFVWIHEMMHIAGQHSIRQGKRHSYLWNVACDLWINSVICRDFGCRFGGGPVSVGSGEIQCPDNGIFLDTLAVELDFATTTPESIYAELAAENPHILNNQQQQGQGQQQGQQGQGQGQQSQNNQGQQQGQGQQSQNGQGQTQQGQGQQSQGQQPSQGQQSQGQGQQSQAQQQGQQQGQQSQNGQGQGQQGQQAGQGQQSQGQQSGQGQQAQGQGTQQGQGQQQGQQSSQGQGQNGQNGQQGQQQGQGQNGQGGQQSQGQSGQQGQGQGQGGAAGWGDQDLMNQNAEDQGSQGQQGVQGQAVGQGQGQGGQGQQAGQGQPGQGDGSFSSNVNPNQSTLNSDTQDLDASALRKPYVDMDLVYKGKKLACSNLPVDVFTNEAQHHHDKDVMDRLMGQSRQTLTNIRIKKQLEETRGGHELSLTSAGIAMERDINFALAPRYNWKTVLQRKLNAKPKSNYTYTMPVESYMNMGFTFPSRQKVGKNSKISNIKIAIDTSGSVGDAELHRVFTIIAQVLKHFKVDAEVIYWSTNVCNTGLFSNLVSFMKITPAGDGGTDVRCLFEYLLGREEFNGKKEPSRVRDIPLVMIFTDGCIGRNYGEYEKWFGSKTLWVIDGNPRAFEPLFGIVADIQDD